MKALTIRQPWASLIALGVKSIETRSWPTQGRLDGLAVALFATAINEGRAGEVLAHLFDGGAVTYDVAADEILLFDLPPSPDEETPT